jgi:hypothetical protein
MNRRTFVGSLGAAGLGLAAGCAWRLKDHHVLSAADGPAYSPWTDWLQDGAHPMEKLVRAAILAASPHNSQPWKFRLLESGIDVYADTSRRIRAIDPLLREMHIGIGCAVENLLLAAAAAGYTCSFDTPGPSGTGELLPVIRVVLKESAPRCSDLYAAIPWRNTDRGPYAVGADLDARSVQALNDLNPSESQLRIFWFRKTHQMRAFADLVFSATEAIVADPEQSASSARWMRTNWSAIQRSRDGLTYDAQGLTPCMRALAKFLPPLGIEKTNRYWLSATREIQLATAAAFGLIAARDARNCQQLLEAGRLWQRMHLLATVHGIAMQPLSQPVERRDREFQLNQPLACATALAELQQDASWQAVMPFRLGYPTRRALPSPRRTLASVLI